MLFSSPVYFVRTRNVLVRSTKYEYSYFVEYVYCSYLRVSICESESSLCLLQSLRFQDLVSRSAVRHEIKVHVLAMDDQDEHKSVQFSHIKNLSASLSLIERSSAFTAPEVDLSSTLSEYSKSTSRPIRKSTRGRKRQRSWEGGKQRHHEDHGEQLLESVPVASLDSFLQRPDVVDAFTSDLEDRKKDWKAKKDAVARSSYASITAHIRNDETRRIQAQKAKDLKEKNARRARQEARQKRPLPILSTLTPQMRKQLARLPRATQFEKARLAESVFGAHNGI